MLRRADSTSPALNCNRARLCECGKAAAARNAQVQASQLWDTSEVGKSSTERPCDEHTAGRRGTEKACDKGDETEKKEGSPTRTPSRVAFIGLLEDDRPQSPGHPWGARGEAVASYEELDIGPEELAARQVAVAVPVEGPKLRREVPLRGAVAERGLVRVPELCEQLLHEAQASVHASFRWFSMSSQLWTRISKLSGRTAASNSCSRRRSGGGLHRRRGGGGGG